MEEEKKLIWVDETIHTKLKVAAAKQKTTIGEVIKKLLK